MKFVYYNVKLERVIDGDTVRLRIDMGNKIVWTDNFRLAGIDAPERGQVGYSPATAYLWSLLVMGVAKVQTFKPDKYGRYLADIWIAVDGGEMLVNRMMTTEGHAKAYLGGARV